MSKLRMPPLSAAPLRLRRSGLRWLRRSGDLLAAREPVAACYVRLSGSCGDGRPLPLAEEQNDIQVVLAPNTACSVNYQDSLSSGGYQDMVEGGDWDAGTVIASSESAGGSDTLLPLVLVGRRGFENGEGRGALLAGWHEKVRGSWEGEGEGEFGTVLALGTCEQTGIFRGEDMAFLSWFACAPGPAQIVAVSDERCVHSSAVLLQHVRRTPAEAKAITEAVYSWIGERIGRAEPDSFPAFQPEAAHGILQGRWPIAQDLLYALHLLAEAVGTSPILERSEVFARRGIVEVGPPNAIALTLGSEFAPHFRHRRTGWILAIHGFRFGPFIGSGLIEWLRRDFDRMPRTVEDSQRDLASLADEVRTRTGGSLIIQNLIASCAVDRVSNYAWLGDAYAESVLVLCNEANLMLSDLTRRPGISMVDSDAMAAELGVKHCPDRFHASRNLIDVQRAEFHRALRENKISGF
ncbi:MAG TPA: hypothetical protein VIJ37_00665 [Steroidobacteraceae bacterium]